MNTDKTGTAKRIDAHRTAEFLVASELIRNRYVVSFTKENKAHLMAKKSDGTLFWVVVAGFASDTSVLLEPKPTHESLFYVIVHVGGKHGDDDFFVLRQEQVNELTKKQEELDKLEGRKPLPGFMWPACQPFRDKWDILPAWPAITQA